MWRTIIEELEKDEAVGAAFPVICNQHPDTVHPVSEPGQLPRIAPDGEYDVPMEESPEFHLHSYQAVACDHAEPD